MEQVLEGHVEIPHDGGVLPQGPPASGPSKGRQHLRAILGKELCVREQRDSPSLGSELGGPRGSFPPIFSHLEPPKVFCFQEQPCLPDPSFGWESQKVSQQQLGKADSLDMHLQASPLLRTRGSQDLSSKYQTDLRVRQEGIPGKLNVLSWQLPWNHGSHKQTPATPKSPNLPAKGLSPPKNSLKTLSGLLWNTYPTLQGLSLASSKGIPPLSPSSPNLS